MTMDDFIEGEVGGAHDTAFRLYGLQAEANNYLESGDKGVVPTDWLDALRIVAGHTFHICMDDECNNVVASEGMLCDGCLRASAGSAI